GHKRREKYLIWENIGVFVAILVLFITVGTAGAARAEVLANRVVLEDRGIGGVLGAAQIQEGTLLTGWTENNNAGWAVFVDPGGKERWSLEGWYLYPTALPNGGFAMVRMDEDGSLNMVSVDGSGRITGNCRLPLFVQGLAAAEESVYVVGNQLVFAETDDEGLPYIACLNHTAEPLWSLNCPSDYGRLQFEKAVYAMGALIIGANAWDDRNEADLGLLYRVDPEGNVLWSVEFRPELGNSRHVYDVCVSEDGIIGVIEADFGYNDDYGYDINYLSRVTGLNMDGEILWAYALNDGEMLIDHLWENGVMPLKILPVRNGFLCAGYWISRMDSGLFPFDWLLRLDEEGNPDKDGVAAIRGGSVEINGVTGGAEGNALLYGVSLDGVEIQEHWEAGDYPGKPFFTALDF
ncbi:MAG: hypothetical protein FWF86_08305, partial [Clostridia bacterium]|nr:hypothetical protein [Clostridia bacterium]